MTALMYSAPLVGLPAMDLLQALGSLLPLGVSPYVVGGLMHLGIGVTLALLYAALFEQILPGPRWARGALFSLLPWLFAITLMGPAMAWVQAAVNPPVEAQVVVNPCGASRPANPCGLRPAPQAANPCAIQPKAVNPCGAVAPKPANPCAVRSDAQAPSAWLLSMMSLMAHLVYGGVMGILYQRRAV
ncbi:MAG: hypothetical protein HY726_00570 [Candidatus Rokubacteria bacterium]|nr:hypothetical protein [Candidatus Rokubacteria bacterium]